MFDILPYGHAFYSNLLKNQVKYIYIRITVPNLLMEILRGKHVSEVTRLNLNWDALVLKGCKS